MAESRSRQGGKEWVDYLRGSLFQAGLEAARTELGDQFGSVETLFRKLEPLDYEEAELTATVYTAWNDLLLTREAMPGDDEIIRQAREEWREE